MSSDTEPTTSTSQMSKDDWTLRLSNWSRFGNRDELGTLNYIKPTKVVAAANLVRQGRVVSLSRVIATKDQSDRTAGANLRMLRTSTPDDMFTDVMTIEPHGPDVTHLDALGHAADAGVFYGGRSTAEVIRRGQLESLSVAALGDGVATRGVLLDVAAAQGIPFFEAGRGVSADDLDRAEEWAGVQVGSGDAVVVHIGVDPQRRKEGPWAGLLLSAIEWIAEREVSIYTGDCIERIPSEMPDLPLPLHTLGIVYVGLIIVDNPDLDDLIETCADLKVNEFLFCIAPLKVVGSTGCPINPLCIF